MEFAPLSRALRVLPDPSAQALVWALIAASQTSGDPRASGVPTLPCSNWCAPHNPQQAISPAASCRFRPLHGVQKPFATAHVSDAFWSFCSAHSAPCLCTTMLTASKQLLRRPVTQGLNFRDSSNPNSFKRDPRFGWGFFGHRYQVRPVLPHCTSQRSVKFSHCVTDHRI